MQEEAPRSLSEQEWAARALMVPSLHHAMKSPDLEDSDSEDQEDNDEAHHLERPFPRVTLSWANLRYAIPAPAEGRWWTNYFLNMKKTKKRAGYDDMEAGLRGKSSRRRRLSTATAEAEELLARHEDDLTGEPNNQRVVIAQEDDDDEGEDEGMKKLLRGVEGIVYPGELCAIMGASGAGKTTLLDVLACRGVKGRLRGEVKLNGESVAKKQSFFRRVSGYVMQDNLMLDTLTVKETINYAASLRLPSGLTRSEKEKHVDKVMNELRLTHIADSMVGGSTNRSISGGELKRVAIAIELVSSPSLLFLDEPTSGLDSNGATDLVQMLKSLAVGGQRTVLCTIHQPSSQMFGAFDKLLLLSQGRVIYFGKADKAVDYFAGLGIRPPPMSNPAEFILDIAFHAQRKEALEQGGGGGGASSPELSLDAGGCQIRSPVRRARSATLLRTSIINASHADVVPSTSDLASQYRESSSYTALLADLQAEGSPKRLAYYEKENAVMPASFGVSIFAQMWILFCRELLHMRRHPDLFYSRLLVQLAMGFVMGSLWYQIEEDHLYVQNCLGVIYMTITMLSFTSFSSVASYINQNGVFHRERASGMYAPFSYFVSKVIVAFAFIAVLVFLECNIVYWMVGLRADSWHYFAFFVFVITLAAWAAEALIFAISSLTRVVQVAQVCFAFILGFFFIFTGFLINTNSIPYYYAWAKYSSFIKYGFEVLVYNEFVGRVVSGVPGEAIIAQATEGLNIWLEVGVLAGMMSFYLAVAFLALQFLDKEKR